MLYNSPKPVVILVLRSWGRKPRQQPGVVVIRRGIEPHKGEWAFPGGYIDHAEDWKTAAARECFEELGFRPDPEHFRLRQVVTTPTNFLVMFVTIDEYVLTSRDWANHDLSTTLNDTGEQEVLEIACWGEDEIPKGLGVPSHNAFFQAMRFTP